MAVSVIAGFRIGVQFLGAFFSQISCRLRAFLLEVGFYAAVMDYWGFGREFKFSVRGVSALEMGIISHEGCPKYSKFPMAVYRVHIILVEASSRANFFEEVFFENS